MELKCGECGVVFCGGVDGEINAGIEGKEMRGGKKGMKTSGGVLRNL